MVNHQFKSRLAALLFVTLPVASAWAGAPTSSIDADGCETVSGFNQHNRCNTSGRTDGLSIGITHDRMTFRAGGSTGATAYATLYCAADGVFGTALYRGGMMNGDALNCRGDDVNYASKSVCGQRDVCSRK